MTLFLSLWSTGTIAVSHDHVVLPLPSLLATMNGLSLSGRLQEKSDSVYDICFHAMICVFGIILSVKVSLHFCAHRHLAYQCR